jgi:hypothetical protein
MRYLHSRPAKRGCDSMFFCKTCNRFVQGSNVMNYWDHFTQTSVKDVFVFPPLELVIDIASNIIYPIILVIIIVLFVIVTVIGLIIYNYCP